MRRPITIGAVLALLAALLTSIAAGSTPTALAQSPTPYSGGGSANLLEVHAPLANQPIADVILSPASTTVDSGADPRSHAFGSNLAGTALLDSIDLNILSQAEQSAPPDNAAPAEDMTLPLDLSPVVNLGVSNSAAHARWAGDGQCLPVGESLAFGHNDTAQATVLDTGDITVASVNTEGGATFTESEVYMTGTGTVRGLESESTTQVDTVTLFAGTPLEVSIGVASTPTLTATANGQAGGASVTMSEPVLTITTPTGGALEALSGLGELLNDTLITVLRDLLGEAVFNTVVQPILDALGDIITIDYGVGVDTLEPLAPNTELAASDGTWAGGEASVLRLHVSVLPEAAGFLPFSLLEANVDVGHMTAHVAVPQGGISCPPEINPFQDLHKDATISEVAPGGQFDYTLTIPNHPQSPCNLTDVVVTDTITRPPGTEITSVPPADSVDGDTLTWNIGDLAIGDSRTFTVTVQVPENAPDGFVFTDTLKASGNCDGTPVDHTVVLETPEVTDDFEGPCNLGDSNKAASHLEVLPGQEFNYFIHVFNSGAEPCTDVSVTDTLDDRVAFDGCTYECTNEGQEVSWEGLTVPGGSGITLAITVVVDDDADGTLENTAVIDSPDEPDGPTTVTVNGPEITDRSVPAPPNPASRGPRGPLPKTGVELPLAAGGFALLALAFLGLRRRLTSMA